MQIDPKEAHGEALSFACDIAKRQAALREMSAEDLSSMIGRLTTAIVGVLVGGQPVGGQDCEPIPVAGRYDGFPVPVMVPKLSIKERTVTCLVCGKVGKIITARHLATHGLTPEEYRRVYGFKRGAPLAARYLVRDRRAKMQDMKLWERRNGARPADAAPEQEA